MIYCIKQQDVKDAHTIVAYIVFNARQTAAASMILLYHCTIFIQVQDIMCLSMSHMSHQMFGATKITL